MPCDEQRVVFAGKQLEDSTLLSMAGVQEDALLQVLGRLVGGAKKRKKKTYTKPKKLKHKHKKIKLRVLKFYKVLGVYLLKLGVVEGVQWSNSFTVGICFCADATHRVVSALSKVKSEHSSLVYDPG